MQGHTIGVKVFSGNRLIFHPPVSHEWESRVGEAACVWDGGKNWLLSKLRKQTEFHFWTTAEYCAGLCSTWFPKQNSQQSRPYSPGPLLSRREAEFKFTSRWLIFPVVANIFFPSMPLRWVQHAHLFERKNRGCGHEVVCDKAQVQIQCCWRSELSLTMVQIQAPPLPILFSLGHLLFSQAIKGFLCYHA